MKSAVLFVLIIFSAVQRGYGTEPSSDSEEQEGVFWVGTVSISYARHLLGTGLTGYCRIGNTRLQFSEDDFFSIEARYNVVFREYPGANGSRDLVLLRGTATWSIVEKENLEAWGCGCGIREYDRKSISLSGSASGDELSGTGFIYSERMNERKKPSWSNFNIGVSVKKQAKGTMHCELFSHYYQPPKVEDKEKSYDIPGAGGGFGPYGVPYSGSYIRTEKGEYGPYEMDLQGQEMKGSFEDSAVKVLPCEGGQRTIDEAVRYAWNLTKAGENDPIIILSECTESWVPEEENTEPFRIEILQPHYTEVEKVKFWLREVSKEPGRCMNDYKRIDDESYDLAFDPDINPLYTLSEDGQVAERDGPLQKQIETIQVRSYDYGSRGKLYATVTLKGQGEVQVVAAGHSDQKYVMIPYDYSGRGPNGIADCKEHDHDGASPRTDDEEDPKGRGMKGDGFTTYEEYRGFLVKAEKNGHIRTNPKKKTLFIASDLTQGIGYAERLPYDVVEIEADEFREEDCVMNGCRSNAQWQTGFGHNRDQKALHVEYCYSVRAFGHCFSDMARCGWMCCPNHCQYLYVDRSKICRLCGPTRIALVTDAVDDQCIRKTIAHEVGHAIGMCWDVDPETLKWVHDPVDSSGRTTYMVAGYPWLKNPNIHFPYGYGDHNLADSDLTCTE